MPGSLARCYELCLFLRVRKPFSSIFCHVAGQLCRSFLSSVVLSAVIIGGPATFFTTFILIRPDKGLSVLLVLSQL